MNTPTERSVEEIVEESKKCLIKVGSENHLDLSCIREIIETERQKREEIVEAEKYRILRVVRDFQLNYTSANLIREWNLLNKVKLVIGKSDITQPNNPN